MTEQQDSSNNKFLDTILRELNPVHDMDTMNFKKIDIGNSKERSDAFSHNLSTVSYGAYLAKLVARGLVAGSIFGAALGLFIDYPFIDSIKDGALLGLVLDVKQMSCRTLYQYFKTQFL